MIYYLSKLHYQDHRGLKTTFFLQIVCFLLLLDASLMRPPDQLMLVFLELNREPLQRSITIALVCITTIPLTRFQLLTVHCIRGFRLLILVFYRVDFIGKILLYQVFFILDSALYLVVLVYTYLFCSTMKQTFLLV